MRTTQMTYQDRHDADLLRWNREEQCPSCCAVDFVVPAEDDDVYVDDEDLLVTQYGNRWLPYKRYVCESCGCVFRVYLGPVKIEVTMEGTRE